MVTWKQTVFDSPWGFGGFSSPVRPTWLRRDVSGTSGGFSGGEELPNEELLQARRELDPVMKRIIIALVVGAFFAVEQAFFNEDKGLN